MSKTTILLVDDRPVIRLGLRAALEKLSDFRIVAEADNTTDAAEIAERLVPDVLISDLTLKGMPGIVFLREIRRRSTNTRVIFFTDQVQESQIRSALREGVSGYLAKDSDLSEVADAVRVAASGGRFLGESIAAKVMRELPHLDTADTQDPQQSLTEREKEVLKLSACGNTYAEIAGILAISRRTVETHRARLMRKLGLSNLADLVRYAIRSGYLSLDR